VGSFYWILPIFVLKNLKAVGIADLTASMAPDVFPHSPTIAERHLPCICGKLDNRSTWVPVIDFS
jgi:hypothetical protein